MSVKGDDMMEKRAVVNTEKEKLAHERVGKELSEKTATEKKKKALEKEK